MNQKKWSFWIDRGGTFTDIVAKSPKNKIFVKKFLSQKNIPFKTSIKLYCIPSNKPIGNIDVIQKIGFVEDIIESKKADFGSVKSFIIKNYC